MVTAVKMGEMSLDDWDEKSVKKNDQHRLPWTTFYLHSAPIQMDYWLVSVVDDVCNVFFQCVSVVPDLIGSLFIILS